MYLPLSVESQTNQNSGGAVFLSKNTIPLRVGRTVVKAGVIEPDEDTYLSLRDRVFKKTAASDADVYWAKRAVRPTLVVKSEKIGPQRYAYFWSASKATATEHQTCFLNGIRMLLAAGYLVPRGKRIEMQPFTTLMVQVPKFEDYFDYRTGFDEVKNLVGPENVAFQRSPLPKPIYYIHFRTPEAATVAKLYLGAAELYQHYSVDEAP